MGDRLAQGSQCGLLYTRFREEFSRRGQYGIGIISGITAEATLNEFLMDAGIGSRVEAIEEIGTLQHHGCCGSCGSGLLLPAKLQQVDACEGGGRGSGSTIRLKGAEDAGGSGSSSVSWFGLLGCIPEAIA